MSYLKIASLFLILFTFSCGSEDNSTENNPSEITVTDIDGNIYDAKKMCDGNYWMLENLNVSRYRNGDLIPQVQDPTEWINLTTGAWCYYENQTSNGSIYGKLYNWYAVNDPRGLAPQGWHIPQYDEWMEHHSCLSSNEGGKLKQTGTVYWSAPNTGATNETGFTGLPNGLRSMNGTFNFLGLRGYWWSSTEHNLAQVKTYDLNYDSGNISTYNINKESGMSVRCVKD